ncbi:MAG: flavodoxin family protein [Desulfovibrio sp.]|nr:flavodoxin family protein [Desulfovibrio sp.]
MSKKIVVITGSPRKKGNIFAMVDAFVASAESYGHTVTRFDAAFKNKDGCHACNKCYQNGKPCAFNEAFNEIAPEILDAKIIVFAMPVYFYSIPAQIKGIIDCMYSFLVGEKPIGGKKCAIISCCEDTDTSVFDGVVRPIERSAAFLKWTMIDSVLIPEVLNPGDINKTNGCAQAAALAAKL